MGLAETFKALSDPVRREILMMLRDGKKNGRRDCSPFSDDGCDGILSSVPTEKSGADFGGAAEKFYLLSVEHQRVRGDDAVDCTVFRPKGRGKRK